MGNKQSKKKKDNTVVPKTTEKATTMEFRISIEQQLEIVMEERNIPEEIKTEIRQLWSIERKQMLVQMHYIEIKYSSEELDQKIKLLQQLRNLSSKSLTLLKGKRKNEHKTSYSDPYAVDLVSLSVDLRSRPIEWIKRFIQSKGLVLIIDYLRYVNLESKQKNTLLEERAYLCMLCLKALMNSKFGMSSVLAEKDTILVIALYLRSNYDKSQLLAAKLLGALCLVKDAYQLVLDAFEYLAEIYNGLCRFDCLVTSLKTDLSNEIKVALFSLINGLIQGSDNSIHRRVALRKEFNAMRLEKFMNKLEAVDDFFLKKQMNIYRENAHKDALFSHEHTMTNTKIIDGILNLIDVIFDVSNVQGTKNVASSIYIAMSQLSMELSIEFGQIDHLLHHIQEAILTDYPIESTIRVQNINQKINDLFAAKSKDASGINDNTQSGNPADEVFDKQVETIVTNTKDSFQFSKIVPPVSSISAPVNTASSKAPPQPPLPPSLFGIHKMNPGIIDSKAINYSDIDINPRKPLRQLHWTRIPTAKINQTIWSNVTQPKIAKDVESDLIRLEELFSIYSAKDFSNKIVKPRKSSSNSKKGKDLLPPRFSDTKILRNFGILLRNTKTDVDGLIRSILEAKKDYLPEHVLIELIHMVPTEEEAKVIRRMDLAGVTLMEHENFFYKCSKILRCKVKLRCMLFKRTFDERATDLISDLTCFEIIAKEIVSSKKFKKLLELILLNGNYMNAGKPASAKGFRLDSLLKLRDTKSTTESKYTLLHHIVDIIKKKYPDLLSFKDELSHMSQSLKLSLTILEEEVQHGQRQCIDLEQELELIKTEEGPEKENQSQFYKTMRSFFSTAKTTTENILRAKKAMNQALDEMLVKFGEDPQLTSPEELLNTVYQFILSFDEALDENGLREKETESSNKPEMVDTFRITDRRRVFTSAAGEMLEGQLTV